MAIGITLMYGSFMFSHKIRNFLDYLPENLSARRSCHPLTHKSCWILLVKLIKVTSEQEVFFKGADLENKEYID